MNSAKDDGIISIMMESSSKQEQQKKKIVRLVVISDTHGHHDGLTKMLPAGDILIHCGDFTNKGSLDGVHSFLRWISSLSNYTEKIVIDGNHDRNLQNPSSIHLVNLFRQLGDPSVVLLQDECIITKDGLSIYGASWKSCEENGAIWNNVQSALQQLRAQQQQEKNSKNKNSHKRNATTMKIDVLLAHKNPCIHKDIVTNQIIEDDDNNNAWRGWMGSSEITKTVIQNQIQLSLGGHKHFARGVVRVNNHNDNDDCVFVNAASLLSASNNEKGKSSSSFFLLARPVVIDYDVELRKVMHVHCEMRYEKTSKQ